MTVLVTGGASGIGRGIVEAFAARGRDIVVADIDGDAAAETAAAVQRQFPTATVTSCALDVTDVPRMQAVIIAVDARTPLSVVVCNAGVAFRCPTVDVSPEQFDRLMAINVRGVYFTMQAALRCMLPRASGAIINVASTSAFTASTGAMSAYDASKAAVRLMTSAVAKEYARSGVRVNAVAPGTVETALVRELASAEQLATLASGRVPMGRLGQPTEIGAACVFLASDAASYVLGHTLVVDGGWLA